MMALHSLRNYLASMLVILLTASGGWGYDGDKAVASKEEITGTHTIRHRINDDHLHFVNFIQHTDGIDALLHAMDRLGVEHTMLASLPVVKKWDSVDPKKPGYYLDNDSITYYYSAGDVLLARTVTGLPAEKRKRIHPFICGFNPTDKNAVDHLKRMIEWYPDLWEGIGELLLRHNYLSHLTGGEQARADHPALDPVYELAAEKQLPVLIHSDIGTPWLHEPIYLHEVENALKKHPRTHFLWAHAGFARNMHIDGVIAIYRRLLSTYPNLTLDLAGSFFKPVVLPDGKANKEWVELIEQFPDRFTIGTDKIGHFAKEYQERVTQTYILLDALKPDTAAKVARENFLRVLPRKGVR